MNLAACATRQGGRFYESEQWRRQKGSLGNVAVIIAEPEFKLEADKAESPARPDDVEAVIKIALAKLPGTTVLDDVTKVPLSTVMGDKEAIALAKAHGAQSVCVVSISKIGNMFSIGFLPPIVPIWTFESFALYSVRLLDVQTGDTLASAITSRRDGGNYQFARWNIFLKDLQYDLSPPKPAGQP